MRVGLTRRSVVRWLATLALLVLAPAPAPRAQDAPAADAGPAVTGTADSRTADAGPAEAGPADVTADTPRGTLAPPFASNGGHAFTAPLPDTWPGDGPAGPRSRLAVLEDGVALGPAHALHDEIRRLGGGRYSHWGTTLYFSSSDGSDPNTNGRRYTVEYRVGLGELDHVGRPAADAAPPLAPWPPAGVPSAPPRDAPTRIYWYTIDALRADVALADLPGADGVPIMPALAAFAEQAVVFETAYAHSSFTKTSTASMFTGVWPSRHRVDHGLVPLWPEGATFVFDLDPRWVTLAECLAAGGYETWTHAFSRHVHERSPQLQGFARTDLASDDELPLRTDASHWFAYEHVLGVHGPYAPSAEALRRMPGGELPPDRVDPATTGWFEGPLDAGQLASLRRAYLAEAYDADRRLARRLDGLRAAGDWDAALVIVTADHGEAFGEHGLTQHTTHLYEEGVRVPLLIKFPADHPFAALHGRRVPHRVGLVDLMPTLLELTGAPAPPYPLDGRSLLSILRDEESPAEPRPVVLRSSFLREVLPGAGPTLLVTEAVVVGSDKAHFGYRLQSSQDPARPFRLGDWIAELYDLEADPGETRELIGRRAGPGADRGADSGAERFLELLAWHRRQGTPPGLSGEAGAALPADVLERLRQLGYLRR